MTYYIVPQEVAEQLAETHENAGKHKVVIQHQFFTETRMVGADGEVTFWSVGVDGQTQTCWSQDASGEVAPKPSAPKPVMAAPVEAEPEVEAEAEVEAEPEPKPVGGLAKTEAPHAEGWKAYQDRGVGFTPEECKLPKYEGKLKKAQRARLLDKQIEGVPPFIPSLKTTRTWPEAKVLSKSMYRKVETRAPYTAKAKEFIVVYTTKGAHHMPHPSLVREGHGLIQIGKTNGRGDGAPTCIRYAVMPLHETVALHKGKKPKVETVAEAEAEESKAALETFKAGKDVQGRADLSEKAKGNVGWLDKRLKALADKEGKGTVKLGDLQEANGMDIVDDGDDVDDGADDLTHVEN